MNPGQSGARFRLVAVLALMIALALGSFWVLEVMRRSAPDAGPAAERTEPDFYVEKFSYVKMSKTGEASYHMSGTRLTHNPSNDSYDIQKPVVKSLSADKQSAATLNAERARVDGDYSQVHLYDNVEMDRPATPNAERLNVKSDYMLLLPDDDVVKTDRPTVIVSGQSVLKGTGMYFNNATRELRMSSNVHGTYQAPAR